MEAAGQLVPNLSKRAGLYLHPVARMRSVLFAAYRALNPSIGSSQINYFEISQSMSLYRAGLELASFLPLGIALAVARFRFHRCELRFHSAIAGRGDPIDRTRVRK